MSSKRVILPTVAALLVTAAGAAPAAAGAGPTAADRTEGSAQQTVRMGVKPIGRSSSTSNSGGVSLRSSAPTGAVTPKPLVYLVFWGSQWSTNDPASAAPALQNLFSSLHGSGDTWGTILDQYCENAPVGTVTCPSSATFVLHPTVSILGDVWFDASAPAPAKATTSQIAAEAVRAAGHFGTSAQANLNAQYVIASPSGTHPDGFPHSFCAWHSSTTGPTGNIAYTNLPYIPDLPAASCTSISSPGPLDGYESTESHEYAETVTDPFPSNGWLKGGSEIGDLCVNYDTRLTLNGATFDLQDLWSNAAGRCVAAG